MKCDAKPPILQACAVPYRLTEGGLEFCLITSSRKGRWGFPKGVVDPGETPVDTALKEALEEAGLGGRIEGESLGGYVYSKWGESLSVSAFLMRVTEVESQWKEAEIRKRQWCRPEEARKMLRRKSHRRLLKAALKRIDSGRETEEVSQRQEG
jgi:phosphohistidine phosphatase